MADLLATLQGPFTFVLVMPLAAEFGKRAAKADAGADGHDAVVAAAAADPP